MFLSFKLRLRSQSLLSRVKLSRWVSKLAVQRSSSELTGLLEISSRKRFGQSHSISSIVVVVIVMSLGLGFQLQNSNYSLL